MSKYEVIKKIMESNRINTNDKVYAIEMFLKGWYTEQGLEWIWQPMEQETINRLSQLIEEKVDEIFLEMQNSLNIDNGDIFPLDAIALDECKENMAVIIERVLNIQKNK